MGDRIEQVIALGREHYNAGEDWSSIGTACAGSCLAFPPHETPSPNKPGNSQRPFMAA